MGKKKTKKVKKVKKNVQKNKQKELTDKQKRFCQEYVISLNGMEAAIKAGFKEKTAKNQASRMLTNVNFKHVQDEIARLQDLMQVKTEITKDYVLSSLKEVVERCMQRKAVMVFDYESKTMVHKKEENEEGEMIGLYEFDSRGANKALELLGKHLALFTDKHKVSPDVDDKDFILKFFGVSS